jgi:hypothetical protein
MNLRESGNGCKSTGRALDIEPVLNLNPKQTLHLSYSRQAVPCCGAWLQRRFWLRWTGPELPAPKLTK